MVKKILMLIFSLMLFSSCQTPQSKLLFPIIYFDLDGTLLNSNKEIRPKVIEAINKYKQCGGKVGIATGRSYAQSKDYFSKIKPNFPIVLSDGALVLESKNKRVIKSSLLDAKILKVLENLAPNLKGLQGVYIYYKKNIDQITKSDDANLFAKDYFMTIDKECSGVAKCLMQAKNNPQKGTPLQIIFLFKKEYQQQTLQIFKDNLKNQTDLYASPKKWSYIAVSPKGNNKANTIGVLLKERGFSFDDVVFFGDASNDTQMLASASLGIAMKVCHPDSCQAATFVTGSNDSDAIAHVIERLILKSTCK